MTDIPPGEWSEILVGEYWPDGQDVLSLECNRAKRAATRSEFASLAELLLSAQKGPLSEQQGRTADDLRRSFRRGEEQAREVATLNGIKEDAYRTAYDSLQSLRHDLTIIAEEGNSEINQIRNSKLPPEVKAAQIVAAIQRYQALSAAAAAKYAGNVVDAMQRLLDHQETGRSARQFARDHGVDLTTMFQPHATEDELKRHVHDSLERPSSPMGVSPGFSTNPGPQPPTPHGEAAPAWSKSPIGVNANFSAASDQPLPHHATQVAHPAPSSPMGVMTGFTSASGQSGSALPLAGTTVASPPPSPRAPTGWAPATSGASTPQPRSPGTTMAFEPALPHTQTVSPAELAQSFNKGMESGAPLAAPTHAAPSLPMTSTEPQISHPAPTIPSAVSGRPLHAPVVDTPTPAPTHHAPAPEATQATPIVAAAPQVSPPVTPQAVGPLPTYGSDLRPAVSTTVTSPPPATPPPVPAAPTSAPVTPSSGQSAPNQSPVVRQTTPPTSPPPPSTIGTQAVVATATGAAVGAASGDATARKRLQRLVTAVARQQPRLAWAAGDRPGNYTVLVTDLASGWIPPGIDLPSAVTLLTPERRRGDLESLLGDVAVTASYTPIHHVPDQDEPPPTSPRPRFAADITDLGWELSQATQWRDGLPRLAHTLAKAASAGTGVLDSEIELLHEHLEAVSTKVLDSYPNDVKNHDVGNWQLLAAIDALVADDKAAANYHLAWFLAVTATGAESRQYSS